MNESNADRSSAADSPPPAADSPPPAADSPPPAADSAVEPSPIAIIGIACMFPGAEDVEAFWANIRDGVDSIRDIPESHWPVPEYFDADPRRPDHTYARRGGFLDAIDFDPLEHGIAPRDVEATDTSQLLGLVAAKRALVDAGYGPGGRSFDRERTSVIVGVTGALEAVIPLGARLGHPIWQRALRDAGVDEARANEVVRRIGDSYVGWQENSFPGLLGNVVAGRIANRLDLHGTNCVVDAACASSLSAVHLAMLELQTGRTDMALSGGIDTFNDIFMYMCFSKTPALSPSGEARPFDRSADGTTLGEGLGIVVLKRLADAKRDDDHVYAVIRGVGSASDGSGTAIYSPSADGQVRAIRRAYQIAGVSPRTIELVEAHGTGTRVGDATEVAALTEVYGEEHDAEPWCALGSVKANIGHTKAAAGAAGLIKAALALDRKVVPPTIKIDAPTEALGGGALYANTEKRPWIAPAGHPRRAAVSAFGFGGSNFHCLLEESASERSAVDWDGRVQILAFSGRDPGAIGEQLGRVPLTGWGSLREFAAEARRTFDLAHDCRLVLVLARDGASVQRRVEAALEGLRDPDGYPWGLRDLYFGRGSGRGRLAALFPGQGAQYVGMLRDFACAFPAFQRALGEADGAAGAAARRLSELIYPRPAFTDETRAADEAALRATEVAQPALGAVSLGALRALQHFDVRFEAAAGHSYGELVALCAAGRLSAGDLLRLSRTRGELMGAAKGDRGAMLAVIGDLGVPEALLARHGLDLIVANKNSPRQVVLSGATAEIERASVLLHDQGLTLKRLAVSAAFHSPLVADASGPFGDALASVELGAAAIPVYANTTAGPYPADEAATRGLLAGQLGAPVDFSGSVENMLAAGISDFIEVGPGARLGHLVRETLGDRAGMVASLDASAGAGSGMLDLARVLASLAARGHVVNLTRWDEGFRPPVRSSSAKLLIPLTGANHVAAKAPAPAANASDAPTAAAASRSPVYTPPSPSIHGSALAMDNRPPSDGSRTDSSLLAEALRATEASMQALVQMQGRAAELHQQFLAGQQDATRSFEALVQRQQEMFASQLGLASPAGAIQPTVEGARLPIQPTMAPPLTQPDVMAPPQGVTAEPAGATPDTTAGAGDDRGVVDALLSVVSEKTGYPSEMLELSMDLHGDLGIDSIKRVEILGGLQEKLPAAPTIGAEHLGQLRTLGDIADFLAGGSAEQAAPRALDARPPASTSQPTEPVGGRTGFARGQTGERAAVARYLLTRRALDAGAARSPVAGLVSGSKLWVSRSGDGLSEAIVAELCARGVAAEEIAGDAATPPPADLAGLVLVAPRGGEAETGSAPGAGAAGPGHSLLRRCFAQAQAAGPALRAAGRGGGALLATVSRLDGSFALGELDPRTDVVSGGLAGLAKTARHEWPEVCCKAIDLDAAIDDLAWAAGQISDQLLQDGPAEVGIDRAGLWSLELVAEEVSQTAAVGDGVVFGADDLVVISGGARGITAEVATALAQAGQPKLVLLGRSPEPSGEDDSRSEGPLGPGDWARSLQSEVEIKRALAQRATEKLSPRELEQQYRALVASREIRATLERVSAAGSTVRYRSVDVRDARAVQAVISEISAELGPVTALVHGAGVLADRLIEDKSEEDFARVVETKVSGLEALLQALSTAPLKALVCFSSSTARFGRRGQVDYAMANEVLNKIAQREMRRRPDCRVVSVNWGPWEGGMVTPALAPAFREEGVELIDLAAGARYLIEELARPDGPAEVVVLGAGSRQPEMCVTVDQRASQSSSGAQAAPQSGSDGGERATVFDRTICLETHRFLRDHVIDGSPVLPVAMSAEWLAHGALHGHPGLRFCGFDGLRVLKGVILPGDKPVELRVRAGAGQSGADAVIVPVEICSARGNGHSVVYTEAQVHLVANRPPAPEPEPNAQGPSLPVYPHSIEQAYRSQLFHGESLQGLTSIEGCGAEGIIGSCSSAPRPDRWMQSPPRNRWISEPLAIDGAFQLMILWSIEQTGRPCLPVFVESYRQFCSSFPASVRIVARVRSHERHLAVADIDWMDSEGQLVARMQGYQCAIDGALSAAFERNRLELRGGAVAETSPALRRRSGPGSP